MQYKKMSQQKGRCGVMTDSITVEVKAKLDVPRNTAEACLKLVEMYINNNPGIDIVSKKNEDGTETLRFDSEG
jgi:hypothetical protein